MICRVCVNEIKKGGLYTFRKDACICQKCFNDFKPIFYKFKINDVEALAIYSYDETIQKHLYAIKGCYDIELAIIFLSRYIFELRNKYRGYYLVPLPSSKEDDELRGFNHVIQIFKPLNMKFINCIEKAFCFKQSEMNKEERGKIISKLKMVNINEVTNKKILIVDDVMTTGSSVKAAIELIKKGRPKKIKVLVMSRKLPYCQNNTNAFSFFFRKEKRY